MTVPELWPRSGIPITSLLQALYEIHSKAQNVPIPPEPDVTSYVRWATESTDALQYLVQANEIDQLIRRPAFWAALNMQPGTEQSRRFVQAEMRTRLSALQRAITSLEQFQRRFSLNQVPTTFVVPDTNVLVEYPGELTETNWHDVLQSQVRLFNGIHFVIPLVVIDELDDLKRVNRTRSRARAALKVIYSPTSADPTMRQSLQLSTEAHGPVWLEVLVESPGHVRFGRADDEIVGVAAQLSGALEQPVLFVTYDTGAALRAASAGVNHVLLNHRDHD